MKGVETFVGRDMQSLHRACMQCCNLIFCTCFQSSLDVAVENHITLVLARRLLIESRRSGGRGLRIWDSGNDCILKALESACAERGTSMEDLGLRARYRIELRRVSVSSPLMALHEALEWRQRTSNAMQCGWQEFSAVWAQLLQHPQYPRQKTPEQAAAYVQQLWEKKLQHCWDRIQARWHSPGALITRYMRRITFYSNCIQRALAAEAVAARREARKVAARQRAVDKERQRWLNRSDLTTEEMMQGLPPHLRRDAGEACPKRAAVNSLPATSASCSSSFLPFLGSSLSPVQDV